MLHYKTYIHRIAWTILQKCKESLKTILNKNTDATQEKMIHDNLPVPLEHLILTVL